TPQCSASLRTSRSCESFFSLIQPRSCSFVASRAARASTFVSAGVRSLIFFSTSPPAADQASHPPLSRRTSLTPHQCRIHPAPARVTSLARAVAHALAPGADPHLAEPFRPRGGILPGGERLRPALRVHPHRPRDVAGDVRAARAGIQDEVALARGGLRQFVR